MAARYALATVQLNAGSTAGSNWFGFLDVDLRESESGKTYAVAIDPETGVSMGIVQEDPDKGRTIVPMDTVIGAYEECVHDGAALIWRPRRQDKVRAYLCLRQPVR